MHPTPLGADLSLQSFEIQETIPPGALKQIETFAHLSENSASIEAFLKNAEDFVTDEDFLYEEAYEQILGALHTSLSNAIDRDPTFSFNEKAERKEQARLDSKGWLRSWLRGHVFVTCPTNQERGYFRVHFLGRLHHPEELMSWYMKSTSYFSLQLKASFLFGFMSGFTAAEDQEKKDSIIIRFIFGIAGFFLGLAVRLPLAFVAGGVQSILALFQTREGWSGDEKSSSIFSALFVLLISWPPLLILAIYLLQQP